MTTPEAIRRRQITTNRLLAAVLVLMLIAAAYQFIYVNPRNAATHSALCAEREQLEVQVDQTEHFLAHPNEFPQFSDPKTLALIRAQVEGQKRTVASFAGLHC